MRHGALYAKISKCHFGKPRVEYLGHYILCKGVETNSKKIKTILQWPQPRTQRDLRSFLGLRGYYTRFIKSYAHVCRTLTDLLRKYDFVWNEAAITAFQTLKRALTTTLSQILT